MREQLERMQGVREEEEKGDGGETGVVVLQHEMIVTMRAGDAARGHHDH